MCGICGVLTWKDEAVQVTGPLTKMVRQLRRRGPDDEGYLLAGFDSRSAECYAGDETALLTDEAARPEYYPLSHVREAEWPDAQVGFGHRRLSIIDLLALGHQPMCTPDRRYWIMYNGEIYN